MSLILKGVKYALPLGIFEAARYMRRKLESSYWYGQKKYPAIFSLLEKNKELKNRHKGKRCFIVGTGPSINQLDVGFLKNEFCIFLSQFYFHDRYREIIDTNLKDSKYHFIPGFSFHEDLGINLGVQYKKQIAEKVPASVTLLFDVRDEPLVRENNICKYHNINYFFFNRSFEELPGGIDATNQLYNATNAPLMAAELALYMGFKEIYFLGIDYCYCPKHKGSHFYDARLSIVDEEDDGVYKFKTVIDEFAGGLHTIKSSYVLENECRIFLVLWNQWRILNAYCRTNEVVIANASPISLLDIIPRITYESLF